MPGMSERSSEVLYWRLSLGIIGFLASLFVPALATDFPQLAASTVFVGLGFVAGGVIGRYRGDELQGRTEKAK